MTGNVEFVVDDMTCGHCEATVRKALAEGLPGAAVSIDINARTVTVEGDAMAAEAVIRDAGYTPVQKRT
ncbi:heavy-metal-associated domain-containing protein [Allorhizobium undicola]|uniref:heavy-metal-associated domain-containing protein n=1 Tax=Allorhizobium undicola TaxID=78527 RepID=UPI0004831A6F|nr:heavy-metal-associated domain-containing protein [Allorhizobium undicola]